MTTSSTLTAPTTMAGPLTVSATNPRYFTHAGDPTGRAVYLTGSHIWNNLHDGMGPGAEGPAEPERFDFDALPALPRRARPQLHPAVALGAVPVAGRRRQLPPVHDAAAVGAHRARQRRRTASRGSTSSSSTRRIFDGCASASIAAGDAGIYVGVMLFDGWALHLSPAPDHIEGHPFHAAQQRQRDRGDVDRRPARSCRSTRGSRRSRRRTSARSSTRCTTCPTCSGRSPTSRPATGRSTRSSPSSSAWTSRRAGATRPSGSTG